MADQSPARYVVWRERLSGKSEIAPTRDNIAGFYRIYGSRAAEGKSKWSTVSIFYDDDGTIACFRGDFDGKIKKPDHIEEQIFAYCGIYPIPYNVYNAVVSGQPWPALYETRLPMKVQAGTIWTADIGMQIMGNKAAKGAGRKVLAEAKAAVSAEPDPEAPENERAVMGDNSAPMSIDQKFLESVNDLKSEFNVWLKGIGGKVTSDAEKMMADGYAKRFQQLRIVGDKQRADEKEPHLTAGRDIDAKWKVVLAAATSGQTDATASQSDFLAGKKLKADEEAREAQAAAIRERAAAPVSFPPARAPAAMPIISTGAKLVDVKVCVVEDIELVLKAYITTPGAKTAAREWAERAGPTFETAIPGTRIEIQKETKL